MIIEHTYNQHDLRKKCYECAWLRLDNDDEWVGTCLCQQNRVKDKRRHITDKACKFKSYD